MKFFLILISLLIIPTLTFATESNRESASKKLDSMDLDNFDNETDEEALQKLKKKSADRRKLSEEKKKEKKKEVKKSAEETDEEALQDLKKKAADRRRESDQKRAVKGSNPYRKSQKYRVKRKTKETQRPRKREMQMVTLGGGYNFGLNYPISRHFGLEVMHYLLPTGDGILTHGMAGGVGAISLSYTEIYFSIAYSLLITPIKSNQGIFLRGDFGLMGLGSVKDDDDDDDESSSFKHAGIMFKGGVGFMVGTDTGLTAQLLYSNHITTMGSNSGIEFQLGFYF